MAEKTARDLLVSLERECDSHELLIVNDGSSDSTGSVADGLAAKNPNIRVLHNQGNKGIGYSLRRGMENASKEYLTFWSAGYEMLEGTLRDMLAATERADIVLTYIANPSYRGLYRRAVSRAYVVLMNRLFDLSLRYYHGATVYRSALVRDFIRANTFITDDYVFPAELLLRMLRTGHSYVEVPTRHRQAEGNSDTLHFWAKALPTLKSLIRLHRSIR